jgi:hypothetical protein
MSTNQRESSLNELIDDLNSDNETDDALPPLPPPPVSRRHSSEKSPIKVLPVDLLMDLATNHLNIHEIRAMMNVCKLWSQIFRADVIWKVLFVHHIEKNKIFEEVSPVNCLHPDAQDICFLCGEQLSPQPNSSPGFVIVSSPQQLAKLLSLERQRIELLETNRLGDENLIALTPTKESKRDRLPPSQGRVTWDHYLAIPSSFLLPSSARRGSLQCRLESDYSHLGEGKWYFRYKQLHSEDFCSKSWKSLSESWKWLRSVLRDRLYWIWKASSQDSLESSLDSSSSASSPISASIITRATAKLTSVNWIRFYETLKEEMRLQADALARDLIVTYSTLLPSFHSPTMKDHLTLVQQTYHTCQLYISWCDELDSLLIPLNCHLSEEEQEQPNLYQPNQRYKRSHLGEVLHDNRHTAASDSQRSPHIGDLCSILLRRCCLLQWEVCLTLKPSLQSLCQYLEENDSKQCCQQNSSSRHDNTTTATPASVAPDRQEVIATLLRIYDLIQSLDVPDDTFCSHFRYDQEMNRHLSVPFETQSLFQRCYSDFLLTQHALVSHLREHDRTKEEETMRQSNGVTTTVTRREREILMRKDRIETNDKTKRIKH